MQAFRLADLLLRPYKAACAVFTPLPLSRKCSIYRTTRRNLNSTVGSLAIILSNSPKFFLPKYFLQLNGMLKRRPQSKITAHFSYFVCLLFVNVIFRRRRLNVRCCRLPPAPPTDQNFFRNVSLYFFTEHTDGTIAQNVKAGIQKLYLY